LKQFIFLSTFLITIQSALLPFFTNFFLLPASLPAKQAGKAGTLSFFFAPAQRCKKKGHKKNPEEKKYRYEDGRKWSKKGGKKGKVEKQRKEHPKYVLFEFKLKKIKKLFIHISPFFLFFGLRLTGQPALLAALALYDARAPILSASGEDCIF
jgi:hypothetical protein